MSTDPLGLDFSPDPAPAAASGAYELALAGGRSIPLGTDPVSFGRGPMNTVALTDEGVSWQHAQIWLEGGVPWVRDLGSRNGTRVNEERINGSVKLAAGDRVGMGGLELTIAAAAASGSVFRLRHVEDTISGLRLLVRSNRFRIGGGSGSDLRLEGLPEAAAMLVFHDNGEIWLGTAEGEAPVEVGVKFEVHGRALRVVEQPMDHAPTVEYGQVRYGYALRAASDGPSGPQSVLVDASAARELLLTGNRGVLLYVLARKLVRDREGGASSAEEGWCTTDDAMIAVWGRGAKGPNHLNVLVHRLREHLQEEGFDPWFVEKRRGAIRLRIKDVTLT
jgi:hypothetical protein